MFAVGVDALVDGLLIGISSASGAQAGVVITGALSIEMGSGRWSEPERPFACPRASSFALKLLGFAPSPLSFLGLTFASTLRKQSQTARVRAILVPPLLLLLGGVCGGFIAALLASSPPLHTGLLAFGIAALLYLVTEEVHGWRALKYTVAFQTSAHTADALSQLSTRVPPRPAAARSTRRAA